MKVLAKKKRTLVVGVGGARQAGSDFIRAWKRAEAGLPVEHPVNRLHFTDAALLFKCLSSRRFDLLRHLREAGPMSIRKLAGELKRDYKNVHTDVKELACVGLIEQTDDGLLNVPWDVIVSELPLLAKAE